MEEEIIFLLALKALEEKKYKRTTKIYLRRLRDNRNHFEQSTTHFKNNFRVNKETAKYIIDVLRPHYADETSIPFELKVLSTLHFYGHGAYQKSIGSNSMMAMSQSSVSRNIFPISQLIQKYLGPMYVKFPTTDVDKKKLKQRFIAKFAMKNIIGCIDCCHIAIVAPPQSHPETPARLYMNQKGYYSINAEMIVDADMRYLWVNAKFPGSVHDSGIWTTSKARAHLRNTYSEHNPSILLGDSEYPLEPWLFTPFNSSTRNDAEVRFNKQHIKTRNIAERTFGATRSRFRCLLKHRTLHYSPKVAGTIINAVCTLHNLCISRQDAIAYDPVATIAECPGTADGISTVESHFVEGTRMRDAYAANMVE